MFFLSTKPWYGVDRAGSIDPSAIKAFPDPDKKIEIITGDWGSEVEQRNISLAFASHKGFTPVLLLTRMRCMSHLSSLPRSHTHALGLRYQFGM